MHHRPACGPPEPTKGAHVLPSPLSWIYWLAPEGGKGGRKWREGREENWVNDTAILYKQIELSLQQQRSILCFR